MQQFLTVHNIITYLHPSERIKLVTTD